MCVNCVGVCFLLRVQILSLRGKVRASVNQKLEESGEKEKLKELLRKKLIERGWRDELKEYCKEVRVRRVPAVSTST